MKLHASEIQVNADVSRPRLMPKKSWVRAPTPEEAENIPKMEAKYLAARQRFEAFDARARESWNQNPAPIAPDVYLKWLRTATRRYNERNAERDPTLAGLGHIDSPPRHGEVGLTVAPHEERITGDDRGFDTDGNRVHLHHMPKFESLAEEIEYDKAISVGIGDRTHFHLHKIRDPQRVNETRAEQVDADFAFLLPRLLARGYTEREIARAREKTHDLNNDLGIYRGGR
jgi:hypothetical protein